MRRRSGLRPLFVRGMHGLGDNIFQRPFVRAAASRHLVYLQTPWPELYADLENVRPVRSQTKLRTQRKNERAAVVRWHAQPGAAKSVRISYGAAALERGGIQASMESALPLGDFPFVMDLPVYRPAFRLATGGKPLAIVRPVTERTEWHNASRSPLPEYVAQAAARLAATHHVVAIADLQPGAEWLVGEMPLCDDAFVRGELSVVEILDLMRQADVVVGGVGWIVPAALALGTPTFVYLGGNGAHNAPEVIVDPRCDASRLGFARPTNFCLCAEKHHACDKAIDAPLEQFERWAREQGVAC